VGFVRGKLNPAYGSAFQTACWNMREREGRLKKTAATSAVIPAPALARTGRGGNGGGSAATFFTVPPKLRAERISDDVQYRCYPLKTEY